ncbi:MAG: GNAT family N-acetyltransferase, partial [Chloroflexota bacterium]
AMAGERMYPPGYREISAVCTAPDFQGKGYARLLVTRLAIENWQRGVVPFLHVAPDHEHARTLYERLGFRQRRVGQLLVISH